MFGKKRIQELTDEAARERLLFNGERQMFLEKIEETNRKLIDFMDITRKEALDSYRKGLQDGLNIQIRNLPPEAPYEPVKSMQEHTEAQVIKEQNDKIAKGLTNILNFTGEPQEEDEE
jgi:hypothetical protein